MPKTVSRTAPNPIIPTVKGASHPIHGNIAPIPFITKARNNVPIPADAANANSLSNSSRNGLILHFNNWRIIYHPWVIALVGANELRLSKHLPPNSLQEIAELLYDYGYI